MDDFRTEIIPDMVVDPLADTQPTRITGGGEPPVDPRRRWLLVFWDIAQTLIMALVLYFLIDSVLARVRVENISMQPTLQAGEFILVNKLAYRFGSPGRGDIVVFHSPNNPQEDFIKRVIGLPGDTITVKNRNIYINGQLATEPYIAAAPVYSGTWQVPADTLFVMGDNRNQSLDSHSFGPIAFSSIVGRALVIYWPLGQMKVLTEPVIVNAANP